MFIWLYVENDGDSNGDLPDYMGYLELEVKIGLVDSFVAGIYEMKLRLPVFDLCLPLLAVSISLK